MSETKDKRPSISNTSDGTSRTSPNFAEIPILDDVNGWKDELRNILDGKRDGYLNKLGSLERYINRLKEYSTNRVDYDFADALESVVWAWDVHREREREFFAVMLELIGTFTPVGGYRKVFKFIEFWARKINRLTDKSGYDAKANLLLSAIGSLFAYFEYPPEKNAGDEEKLGYHNFVHLLEEGLQNPSLANHLIILLLQSHRVQMNDESIATAIRTNPKSVYNLVSYVFAVKRNNMLKENIQALSQHIFEIGGEPIDIFQERLKLYKYSETLEGRFLVIKLLEEEKARIELTENALHNYLCRISGVHLLPEYFEEIYRNQYKKDRNRQIQEVLSFCEKNGQNLLQEFRRVLCLIPFEDSFTQESNGSYQFVFIYRNVEVALIGTSRSFSYLQNIETEAFEFLIDEFDESNVVM